jgi:TatD DNase family protein
MLIETDAPFLAPIPYRGKRNEPAFVAQVADQIGTLRGTEATEIADKTSWNFHRFFNITA